MPELFVKALQPSILEVHPPQIQTVARSLFTTPEFLWSRPTYDAKKSVFNLQPCDNGFERSFAAFLDHAEDVQALAKLPRQFGFAIEYADAAGNLRLDYPDFVAVDTAGGFWLLETKGQEDINVTLKDRAATVWCQTATALGLGNWRYQKVPQKAFESFGPSRISQLSELTPTATDALSPAPPP